MVLPTMRRALKFLGFLLVGLALLTGVAHVALTRVTRQWFDKDVALRSALAERPPARRDTGVGRGLRGAGAP